MAEDESIEPVVAAASPHMPPELLMFGKWDSTEVQIKDIGLVRYISLKPVLIPVSYTHLTLPTTPYV